MEKEGRKHGLDTFVLPRRVEVVRVLAKLIDVCTAQAADVFLHNKTRKTLNALQGIKSGYRFLFNRKNEPCIAKRPFSAQMYHLRPE